MKAATSLLPVLLPLIYLSLAFFCHRVITKTSSADANQGKLFRLVKTHALIAVGLALSLLGTVAVMETRVIEVAALDYASIALRLDPLSSIMALMVTTIGSICLLFSRRYLANEASQPLFFRNMAFTLASVSALVLSNSLFLTVCAWIAMSLSMHKLLLHFPHRAAAQRAASKKYIAARIGDLSLLAAAALLAFTFGTDRIDTITEIARTNQSISISVTTAVFLIVFSAIMKSAQFPFNGWLIEVMDTPTPVSALLHAGVVNAGGFLIIRFADLIVLVPETMWLLAIIGGVTAVVGSLAMMSQTSVKVGLAWSTVAQMGMMMLQCGLGAFTLATFHIVAHSAYKAHAFLSAGSAVDRKRMPLTLADWSYTQPMFYTGAFMVAVTIMALMVGLGGAHISQDAGGFLVFGLFVLALMHIICTFLMVHRITVLAVAGLAGIILAIALAYGALHGAAFGWLKTVFSESQTLPLQYIWVGAVLLGLGSTIALHWAYAAGHRPEWLQRLLVHSNQGFYVSAMTDRILRTRAAPKLPVHSQVKETH